MPRWLLYIFGLSLVAAGTVLGLSLHLLVAVTGEDDTLLRRAFALRSAKGADVEAALRRVPVVVVEEHHEALPYWREALTSRRPTPAAVLHFDAHSDLALPRKARNATDFGLASNDEFILAAALDGLVDRFIWVFPTWDSKGPKHRHNRFGVSRRVLVLGRTTNGEPCYCESKDLPIAPERLTSPLGWQSTQNDSDDFDCNDAEEQSLRGIDCEGSKVLQVIMVREEKLSALDAWWPTLLAPPLLLDVDEDHFAQKTQDSRLAHLQQRLQDTLMQLHCPSDASEAQLTSQLRQSIAEMLREVGPSPTAPELGCNESATAMLMKELNSMHQLDLELLLLYGFCFSTSARSVLASPDERYLRVCDVGTEETTRDTDRDPSEMALSEEPRAIHARLGAFEGSLKSLGPWVRKAALVSLCRSVRDGFTPNRVWSQIESQLLRLLGGAGAGAGPVTFDANLLGAAGGWENWTKEAQQLLAVVAARHLSAHLSAPLSGFRGTSRSVPGASRKDVAMVCPPPGHLDPPGAGPLPPQICPGGPRTAWRSHAAWWSAAPGHLDPPGVASLSRAAATPDLPRRPKGLEMPRGIVVVCPPGHLDPPGVASLSWAAATPDLPRRPKGLEMPRGIVVEARCGPNDSRCRPRPKSSKGFNQRLLDDAPRCEQRRSAPGPPGLSWCRAAATPDLPRRPKDCLEKRPLIDATWHSGGSVLNSVAQRKVQKNSAFVRWPRGPSGLVPCIGS